MPGSGKSTIGRLVARRLNWNFVDLDDVIKEKDGKSHAEILEFDGEKTLLAREEAHTLGLVFSNLVFSPGGSIIYSPKAMEKLRSETRVIYLALPLPEIKKRLGKKINDRGIVGLAKKGIEGLFKERAPQYKAAAHHTVDCLNLRKQEIVKRILQDA